MKAILVLCLALAVTVAATGCTGTTGESPAPSGGAGEVKEALTTFAAGSQALLDAADANVSRAADELGRVDLAGPAAEAVLATLMGSGGFVVDTVAYDADRRVVAAAPSGSLVGTRLTSTPLAAPYLGPYAELAGGVRGVALGHPVLDANRATTGGVSIAILPDSLLSGPADAARNDRALALYAVQRDGTILYADDPALVGGQASRPGSGLAGLASQITGTRSGASSHRPANAASDRAILWETVALHGTEWRLVVAQR